MRMNILHLLWIAPLSTTFGFILCSLFTIGKMSDPK